MRDPRTLIRLWFIVVAVLLPMGIVFVFTIPPFDSPYYPRCLFFLTAYGIHCPGCGTARSYHSLLHLRFLQAVAYNIPCLMLIPFYIIELYRLAYYAIRGQPAARFPYPKWLLPAFLIFMLLYGILRNIPYYPFVILAPHEI